MIGIRKTYAILSVFIYMVLFGTQNIAAQLPENGDWHSRVGTVAPKSVEALMQAVFNSPICKNPAANNKLQDYINFYTSFKKLSDIAPYVDYTFYSGYFTETEFEDKTIFERLLQQFPDTAMKMVLLEDIIALGHNMIDHLDSINVLRSASVKNLKSKDDTLSLPVAMVKYAHLYYKYEGNENYCPKRMYDKVKARENYAAAFKLMREKNIDPGSEIEGVYVNEYYRACEDLFKTDEDKYYEQFLQDYLDIVQTCDNLLIPYYDIPDSVKNDQSNPAYRQFQSYNYYTNHNKVGVKALFKASGAATPDRLNDYYMDKLKEHRRDTAYLNKAINMLNENNGSQTQAFYAYCEASYMIKPSFLSCIGCAFASKADGMRDEMVKYFQEAYNLADTDLQRGIIAYQIGSENSLPRPKDPSTGKNYGMSTPEYAEWEKNMMMASANLKQVLSMQDAFRSSSSIAVRQIPAHAAFNLARNGYRMINSSMSLEACDEAIAYAQMAMAAAPDLYNKNAEGLIADISNVRAKVAEANKEKKNLERQRKAYEEYLRKKKAEEDFWNQH